MILPPPTCGFLWTCGQHRRLKLQPGTRKMIKMFWRCAPAQTTPQVGGGGSILYMIYFCTTFTFFPYSESLSIGNNMCFFFKKKKKKKKKLFSQLVEGLIQRMFWSDNKTQKSEKTLEFQWKEKKYGKPLYFNLKHPLPRAFHWLRKRGGAFFGTDYLYGAWLYL